jgi:hypothetical protein
MEELGYEAKLELLANAALDRYTTGDYKGMLDLLEREPQEYGEQIIDYEQAKKFLDESQDILERLENSIWPLLMKETVWELHRKES